MRENTCFAVMLILPVISRAVLQTFRCVSYDDGDPNSPTKRILFVDPAVDCDSSLYTFMEAYAVLMTLIWPVGVPIALMVWLGRLSPYLDPPHVLEEEAIEQRLVDPHVEGSSIAFVALQHRPRYWYYEVVFNLVRRLILTCVVLVFTDKGQFICFVLGVSIITTVSEREMNAHLDPFVGAFIYLMQWQILLCILAMLLMDAQLTNEVGDMSVGVVLMLVNVFMAMVVIFDTRGDVVREAHEKAVMRAKMVRKSKFVKRMSARVSLAASFLQGGLSMGGEGLGEEDEGQEVSASGTEKNSMFRAWGRTSQFAERMSARVSSSSAYSKRRGTGVAGEAGSYGDEDDNEKGEASSSGGRNPMFGASGKRRVRFEEPESASGEEDDEDEDEEEEMPGELSNPMFAAQEKMFRGGVEEAKPSEGRSADDDEELLSVEMITMVGEDVASTDEMEISAEDVEVSTLEAQGASERQEASVEVQHMHAGDAPLKAPVHRSSYFEHLDGVLDRTGQVHADDEVEVEGVELSVEAESLEEVAEGEVEGDHSDDDEARSMEERSDDDDDDDDIGLDEVYGASEDDAAGDNEMVFAATNVIHDAIDAGTLTEEDAHAMIDRATEDDGHVNVGMLTEIVDELQHGESQDKEENPSVSPSQKNMVMKYRAALYAAKWRSQSRLSAQDEEELDSTFTDMLHDAIDAGTLTKEEAHALIDRATRDDGHVDASVIANIVDELQHGEV